MIFNNNSQNKTCNSPEKEVLKDLNTISILKCNIETKKKALIYPTRENLTIRGNIKNNLIFPLQKTSLIIKSC